MRNILFILAALIGFGAFAQTNIPTRQMLADTNGVVKWPTNITRIRIGGTEYTNLLGFGLSVTNGQLSVDTTQLPSGGGSGVVTSVTDDFEIDGGELALTNALGTGPLVRQSAASGFGTVTSVGASTTVSGLGFSGSPVTGSGTLSLTGTVAVASGGTGATDASGARTALSLVPGTDVQAYDVDLAAIAALANSGIIVRTGSGTVSARTITGDTEVLVSNGDGVSGNPTLSIGAAIARDAEVAATYAPLASPALTGSPTVPTASAGVSNTLAASTAYVDRAVASGGGGGSSGVTTNGNNSFTGTNSFSGPLWYKPNRKKVILWDVDFVVGFGVASSSLAIPWLGGGALSSGTSAAIADATNHLGLVRLSSASGANSGYYYASSISQLFAKPLLTYECVNRIGSTNYGVRAGYGFFDAVNTSNPTDAIRIYRSNNVIIPQIWNNTSLTQGYEYEVQSNQFLHIKIQVDNSVSSVTFFAADSDTGAEILSTNLSASLPSTSSRVFGGGIHVFYTNSASVNLEDLDWTTAYIDAEVNR